MKLNHLLLFGLLAFSMFCYASFGQGTFHKLIVEDVGISQPTAILTEADGYLIMLYGYSEQVPGGVFFRRGIKFVKTDFEGNVIWRKKFSEPGKGYIPALNGSLVKTASGYLLGATMGDTMINKTNYSLLKFDTTGTLVWKKEYPYESFKDHVLHGAATQDGGYIITGQAVYVSFPSDYYVLKADSTGNQQWAFTYGGALDDVGLKGYQTQAGDYLLSGLSEGDGGRGYDMWLIKLDSSGSQIWEKYYGTGSDDGLHITPSKNGILIWGSLGVYNSSINPTTAVIMKVDTTGELIWQHFFDHTWQTIIHQLRESDNGDVTAIGHQRIDAANSEAGWITRLSSAGDVLWERLYISPFAGNPEFSNSVRFNGDFQETEDGFIIAGAVWKKRLPINISYPELWLIKLDSNGCLGLDSCGLSVSVHQVPQLSPALTATIYPNPIISRATVSIKSNRATLANQKAGFELYDMYGKLVRQQDFQLNQHSYAQFYFNRANLPAGEYFYLISENSTVLFRGKVMIL